MKLLEKCFCDWRTKKVRGEIYNYENNFFPRQRKYNLSTKSDIMEHSSFTWKLTISVNFFRVASGKDRISEYDNLYTAPILLKEEDLWSIHSTKHYNREMTRELNKFCPQSHFKTQPYTIFHSSWVTLK